MSKNVRAFIVSTSATLLMVAMLCVEDISGDHQYKVEVVKSAPLYSLTPTDYPTANPVVSNLSAGSYLQVLRVRYGKDFDALQVKTVDGNIGWVISGDGVKVMSPGR